MVYIRNLGSWEPIEMRHVEDRIEKKKGRIQLVEVMHGEKIKKRLTFFGEGIKKKKKKRLT